MVSTLYLLVGVCFSGFFLRAEYRVYPETLFMAVVILFLWPLFVTGKIIMRLFNGDWK